MLIQLIVFLYLYLTTVYLTRFPKSTDEQHFEKGLLKSVTLLLHHGII